MCRAQSRACPGYIPFLHRQKDLICKRNFETAGRLRYPGHFELQKVTMSCLTIFGFIFSMFEVKLAQFQLSIALKAPFVIGISGGSDQPHISFVCELW